MSRSRILKSLFVFVLLSTFLSGCGVSNPFCNSARPKPLLTSLAPNPASLAAIQEGLLLTGNGGNFYSSSQIEATITTAQISAPGSAQVVVHTPANLSGDLGCDSGGDSPAVTFTVTE